MTREVNSQLDKKSRPLISPGYASRNQEDSEDEEKWTKNWRNMSQHIFSMINAPRPGPLFPRLSFPIHASLTPFGEKERETTEKTTQSVWKGGIGKQ